MAVLAVGARPSKGMAGLARAADVETNAYGFCKSQELNPGRTSRLGVFAAGSANGAKDIAESVIQSGAAALGASRLIKLFAPIRERIEEPAPEYRDVSRQPPKTLAVLCRSCPIMPDALDTGRLAEKISGLPAISRVEAVERACTTEGWSRIKELAGETQPNRILSGPACPTPTCRNCGSWAGSSAGAPPSWTWGTSTRPCSPRPTTRTPKTSSARNRTSWPP